jgi:Glycosyl hydrolase family 26
MSRRKMHRGTRYWLAILFTGLFAAAPARSAPQLCVIRGNICVKGCSNSVEQFGQWLGRPMSRIAAFANGDSWPKIVRRVSFISYRLHDSGSRDPLNLGLALLPRDPSATLSDGANGAYDEYFRQIGRTLVAAGAAHTDLRLGWEFNGNWYRWRASDDPAAFVAYWRRIVTVLRSVPGEAFTFDWNPALAGHGVPLEKVYPGDAYVDEIGVDIFNDGSSLLSPQQRWSQYLNKPYGLNWLAGFASRHGKRLTVPAWGTGVMKPGHGVVDDSYFVTQVIRWFKTQHVRYACYFDSKTSVISDGSQPQAAKALIAGLGRPHDDRR